MRKLLVANRGEVALRILRTAREMGLETAVVHSDADASSLAVRCADKAINLHKPYCYLDGEAIIAAAKAWGADAIHPGYGFLAERGDFARRCREEGLIFVGADPDSLALFGDKHRARAFARSLGIPVLPGSDGPVADVAEAQKVADELGYPVFIKAVAGGGGRGMRIAWSPDDLARHLPTAMSEARAAFGHDGVYLEKYLPKPRHVEVQLAGDGRGRALHFGERDCSLQRRRQKLLEETPAPHLSPDVREGLTRAALHLAEAARFAGVGTVEFLVDMASGRFYFLETNARLQVEHPVTEMVWDVDLVALQLTIAAGDGLPWRQDQLQPRGAAVECRINAENPWDDFSPAPGRITHYVPPGGPGVRVDGGAFPGWDVPPFYDSLIAKVIVWAPDRVRALRRMNRALEEFHIEGIPTTLPFHRHIVTHPRVQAGTVHTGFLDEEWDRTELPAPPSSPDRGPAPAAVPSSDGAPGAAEAAVHAVAGAPAETSALEDEAEEQARRAAVIAAALAAVLSPTPAAPPHRDRPAKAAAAPWWVHGLHRQMEARGRACAGASRAPSFRRRVPPPALFSTDEREQP